MHGENPQAVTVEQERRKDRRVRLAALVRCDALNSEQEFAACDVSAGGMFVSTPSPLPVGSSVTLSFRLSELDPPLVMCPGHVIHSTMGVGMGIHFLSLREDAYQALEKFVDESH